MWRCGVLLVAVLVVVTECRTLQTKGVRLVRKERSPYYECGPDFPHHHRPHFWPPPPPPPYWPPPPPPRPPPPQQIVYYYGKDSSSSQAQAQAKSEAEAVAAAGAATASKSENLVAQPNPAPNGNVEPCDSCAGKRSDAVSNAKSDTGNAVAIAIARGH